MQADLPSRARVRLRAADVGVLASYAAGIVRDVTVMVDGGARYANGLRCYDIGLRPAVPCYATVIASYARVIGCYANGIGLPAVRYAAVIGCYANDITRRHVNGITG